MSRKILGISCLVPMALLVGCIQRTSIAVGPPTPPVLASSQNTGTPLAPGWREKYEVQPEGNDTEIDSKTRRRDAIVHEMLFVIDENFYKYEKANYMTRATIDFSSDLIQTGLTSATAVVGGEETKSVLGILATGTQTSKANADKRFFSEVAREVLFPRMHANRAEVLVDIQKSLILKCDKYQLSEALVDLRRYFEAGTPIAAYIRIQALTGENASTADVNRKSLKRVKNADETITDPAKDKGKTLNKD